MHTARLLTVVGGRGESGGMYTPWSHPHPIACWDTHTPTQLHAAIHTLPAPLHAWLHTPPGPLHAGIHPPMWTNRHL